MSSPINVTLLGLSLSQLDFYSEVSTENETSGGIAPPRLDEKERYSWVLFANFAS